jgi:RNA recognition motif-containing protein
VTVRGTNQVAAGRHGNNAPSAKKVFVSGLFFDTKPTEVKAMFQSCGKVTSCKLLKFPDTGRCKGQAFVVFDSEEAASKALKLSGTKISSADTDKKGKKNKTTENRELELKVSRAMSRTVTKGKH